MCTGSVATDAYKAIMCRGSGATDACKAIHVHRIRGLQGYTCAQDQGPTRLYMCTGSGAYKAIHVHRIRGLYKAIHVHRIRGY